MIRAFFEIFALFMLFIGFFALQNLIPIAIFLIILSLFRVF